MQEIIQYDSLIHPEKTFVCFDTETTGLNPMFDRIIELAAIKVKNGRVVEEYETFVNPGMPIPEASSNVHGIYDKDVEDAPAFKEIYSSFLKFIKDGILVAHNARFDLDFLNHSLRREGQPLLKGSYIDTLRMSKKAIPKRRSYALQNLARDLNFKVEAAHRALDDTRVCYKLFEHCHDLLNPAKQGSLF